TKDRGIQYPVAVDNDFAIWDAFDTYFWPTRYLADRGGVLRDRYVGGGRYDECERELQPLLGIERDPVRVVADGVEAAADWDQLRSQETYLGYLRGDGLVSDHDVEADRVQRFDLPSVLPFNRWALRGEWTVERDRIVASQAGAALAV